MARTVTRAPSAFVLSDQEAAHLARTAGRAARRRTFGLPGLYRQFRDESARARADRAFRPGARGWAGKGTGRVQYVAGPVEVQATTVQACGLWPFSAGAAHPIVGAPLGHHLITGTQVCADPVMWFLEGLLTFPSCFVLGRPGLGKSTLVRRMITVLAAWGIVPMVLSDLKPDYVDLIEALDGLVIRVGRGRGHLNPLDLGPLVARLDELPDAARREAVAELQGRRLTTFTGLLTLIRGDRLAPHEGTLISVALRLLDDRLDRVPVPADVHDLLKAGPPELRAVALDRGDDERYQDRVEPLLDLIGALGADGPFGDLFAGHTTTPISLDRPMVFDLSSIDDGDLALQAAAQSVCWSYGSMTVSAAKHLADAGLAPARHYFMVMDELWRMLRAGSFMVDVVDALTRLNRQRGLAQALITHTMNDLVLDTEVDTKTAMGFVERSAMVFLGGLADSEMGNLKGVFGMSSKEQSWITDWAPDGTYDPETGERAVPRGRGKFLLKLGKTPGTPFQVDLTNVERDVNDTNRAWEGLAQRVAAARSQYRAPGDEDAEEAVHRAVSASTLTRDLT